MQVAGDETVWYPPAFVLGQLTIQSNIQTAAVPVGPQNASHFNENQYPGEHASIGPTYGSGSSYQASSRSFASGPGYYVGKGLLWLGNTSIAAIKWSILIGRIGNYTVIQKRWENVWIQRSPVSLEILRYEIVHMMPSLWHNSSLAARFPTATGIQFFKLMSSLSKTS